MQRVVLITLLLCACGGEKDSQEASREKQSASKASGTEANANKAGTAPKQDAAANKVDELVTKMRMLSEQPCSCSEEECADKLRGEWKATRDALAEHQRSLSLAQKQLYIKSSNHWSGCTAKDPKTRGEMDGIAAAACECKKNKNCLKKAADGVSDMNNNAKIVLWAPTLLAAANKKAIQCLRKGGMSARAIEKEGVAADLIKAAGE